MSATIEGLGFLHIKTAKIGKQAQKQPEQRDMCKQRFRSPFYGPLLLDPTAIAETKLKEWGRVSVHSWRSS